MTEDISAVMKAIKTVKDSLAELEAKRDEIMKDPPTDLKATATYLHKMTCKQVHAEPGYGCSFRREASWSRPDHLKWLQTACDNITKSGVTVTEYHSALKIVYPPDE